MTPEIEKPDYENNLCFLFEQFHGDIRLAVIPGLKPMTKASENFSFGTHGKNYKTISNM